MSASDPQPTPDASPPGPAPAVKPPPLLGRPELKFAVFYVLVASTWVMASDLVLVDIINIPINSILIHTFKGVNIAATSGVLFYILLQRAYNGWRRSEEKRLADLAASSSRFRNLSSRIQTLREEERTSIAREVHDELGQLLTGIKLKIRMVENHLDGRNDRSLNPQIEDLVEAGDMIDETITAVRRISTGLRPSMLDHLGLAAALKEEASLFSRRTGIACELRLEEMARPLPAAVETTAFRVCQECLTNVARHSGATRVELACETREDALILRVRDNGSGCEDAVLTDHGALGLIGMRERAQDLAGHLEITSATGTGTTVTLHLPLPSHRPPPST